MLPLGLKNQNSFFDRLIHVAYLRQWQMLRPKLSHKFHIEMPGYGLERQEVLKEGPDLIVRDSGGSENVAIFQSNRSG